MKEPTPERQPRRIPYRLAGVACLLLLLGSPALHFRVASKTLGSSLGEGDSQRHFVTGVLFYDYLRTGLGSNPVHFAENSEVRCPEVAIEHWPPMYYAVQSLFYFMAGPTIRNAQILSAIMAALLAMLLFLRLRPEAGPGHRCIGGSESSGRTCGERNTCLGLLRYPDPLLYTEPLLVHRKSSTFSG